MKHFTIENETNNIMFTARRRKPKPSPTPNDSAPKPRWRSWPRTGPQPGWSRSGTACRARPR